jgi:hypothetical protein
LLDLALLGDELFQRFDQRIRIAQGFGDGFLFGFRWWKRNLVATQNAQIGVRYTRLDCAFKDLLLPCLAGEVLINVFGARRI